MRVPSRRLIKEPKSKQQTILSRLSRKRTQQKALPFSEDKVIAPQKHIVIDALAGTGKTFTLVLGLAYMLGDKVWRRACKHLKKEIIPSPQQLKIWEQLREGPDPSSIIYLAFNKSIVKEFGETYKWLVELLRYKRDVSLTFSTIHSLGYRACKRASSKPLTVNSWRTSNLIENEIGIATSQADQTVRRGVMDLVKMCKLTMTKDYDMDTLGDLVNYYGIETEGHQHKIFSLVPTIIEACKSLDEGIVDFDDQIWLPAVNKYPLRQYDLILGDEAQDWNACQQSLILRTGKQIVISGDQHQAIYGFAGADVKSFASMRGRLNTQGGYQFFPLTVTRRCGHKIVDEARRIVPTFEAHESNSQGEILHSDSDKLIGEVRPEDMVVCRLNAPIVSMAFRMIRSGIKATIQGRDIGKGLIQLINRLKVDTVDELVIKLDDFYDKESARIRRRKNFSEAALIAIKDKKDCILCFCQFADSIKEVTSRIESLFSDETEGGVKLSSIHRAKGLEADNVFFLAPEMVPHPMAKSEWLVEQEMNLKYVAITRAAKTLTYVRYLEEKVEELEV